MSRTLLVLDLDGTLCDSGRHAALFNAGAGENAAWERAVAHALPLAAARVALAGVEGLA